MNGFLDSSQEMDETFLKGKGERGREVVVRFDLQFGSKKNEFGSEVEI